MPPETTCKDTRGQAFRADGRCRRDLGCDRAQSDLQPDTRRHGGRGQQLGQPGLGSAVDDESDRGGRCEFQLRRRTAAGQLQPSRPALRRRVWSPERSSTDARAEYDFFDNPRKPGRGPTRALSGWPARRTRPSTRFRRRRSTSVTCRTTVRPTSNQDIWFINSDNVPLSGIGATLSCAGVTGPAAACRASWPRYDSCSGALGRQPRSGRDRAA